MFTREMNVSEQFRMFYDQYLNHTKHTHLLYSSQKHLFTKKPYISIVNTFVCTSVQFGNTMTNNFH